MATLPDLPESRVTLLRSYAERTLAAIEANPNTLPWITGDQELDTGMMALVARGVHSLSADDQELFFHRLGEAAAQRSALDRSSTELLYHVVEALNAAGQQLSRPHLTTQRDERLLAVPGHLLESWRTVLGIGLLQHLREVPDDAYPLAQNALVVYARDSTVGWGLSDSELVRALDSVQRCYLPDAHTLTDREEQNKSVVRRADLDWKDLRALILVSEPEAVDASADSSATSQADAAADPDGGNASGDPDSTDSTGHPQNRGNEGSGPTGDGPDPDDPLFTDKVLPADANQADHLDEPAHGHERTVWPEREARHRDGPHNRPNRPPHNPSQRPPTASGAPGLFHPNGAPSNSADPYGGRPPAENVTIRQSALSGLSEGVGGLAAGLGGLFAGVGAVLSRFAPRPDLAARRWQEQRNQRSLERQYREGTRFLDRFNERLDLLQRDPRVQETFRAIAEDRLQRQEAVRDGADAKSQNGRHAAYVNTQWQKLLDTHPDLRDSLGLLETDAERIPEQVTPALAALEGLLDDPRGRREALLSKLERAKEQADGLPPSTPGKKSLSERLNNVLAAISRFLARLFGGSRVEVVSSAPSSPSPAAATSSPRRATP
jgi:hypothetical protein